MICLLCLSPLQTTSALPPQPADQLVEQAVVLGAEQAAEGAVMPQMPRSWWRRAQPALTLLIHHVDRGPNRPKSPWSPRRPPAQKTQRARSRAFTFLASNSLRWWRCCTSLLTSMCTYTDSLHNQPMCPPPAQACGNWPDQRRPGASVNKSSLPGLQPSPLDSSQYSWTLLIPEPSCTPPN